MLRHIYYHIKPHSANASFSLNDLNLSRHVQNLQIIFQKFKCECPHFLGVVYKLLIE